MATLAIGDIVWNVFGVAAIFCIGFAGVVYIPALIQLLLVKLRVFLIYRSPEYFHRAYIETTQKQIEDETISAGSSARPPFSTLPVTMTKTYNFLPVAFDSNDDIRNFFGYYDQAYFKKSRDSCIAYTQNNFILLIIIAIQITILAVTFIVFILSFNIDVNMLASSALLPTVLALSHFSDYVRGYFAYIWFIWSNKLRLGDEIVIDNERGDLVELGPVTSYIYVYMRAVPMIGSVEAPNSSDPMTADDMTIQPTKPTISKVPTFPNHQAPDQHNNESPLRMPNMQTFSIGRPEYLQMGKTPASPIIVNMHSNSATRPQASVSLNSPFTLRHFGPPKIREVKPGEVTAHPESLHRLQMHRIGYVALPLSEHYRYQVNTSTLLSSNFRNYSYHSVHVHANETKKKN